MHTVLNEVPAQGPAGSLVGGAEGDEMERDRLNENICKGNDILVRLFKIDANFRFPGAKERFLLNASKQSKFSLTIHITVRRKCSCVTRHS